MLTKLILKNFKSHQRLKIKFDPKITTIIGTNYKGKSTVLRAIRWVTFNKPRGNSVINWNVKRGFAKVKLFFDDKTVTRTKSLSKKNKYNYYKLNQEKFSAMGTETPTPVKQQLNLSPINFQGQHDTPFWFGKTNGEVSRELNTIVNLGVIDKTLANIDSQKRKIKETISVIRERKTKANFLKNKLSYVKEMDEDLKRIEALESQKEKVATLIDQLEDDLGQIRHNATIEKTKSAFIKDAEKVVTKYEQFNLVDTSANKLKLIIDKFNEIKEIANKKIPSLANLEKLYTSIINHNNLIDTYKMALMNISGHTNVLNQLETELTTAKKAFQKRVGYICPICHRPFQKKS